MSSGTLNLGAFAGLGSRNLSRSEERVPGTRDKRPPAEFWLNIGYPVALKDEDGNESITFVSLGLGIPLDQIEPFEVRKAGSSNMAALREAQNELHEAIMTEAQKLAPGDSVILFGDVNVGLCVQIKRVRGEVEAPAENPLKRTFNFGGAAPQQSEDPKSKK